MQWHHDAERRHKAGERQRWCGICSRWTWADLAVPGHETISGREFTALVRKVEREYSCKSLSVPPPVGQGDGATTT